MEEEVVGFKKRLKPAQEPLVLIRRSQTFRIHIYYEFNLYQVSLYPLGLKLNSRAVKPNSRCPDTGMAQVKGNAAKGGPNHRHIHSRISYLYQAATYLEENARSRRGSTISYPDSEEIKSTDNGRQDCGSSKPLVKSSYDGDRARNSVCDESERLDIPTHNANRYNCHNSSSHLLSHLRAVSQRSQIRITPDIKRSICKHCDALLLPGNTATTFLENESKSNRKPWADVVVVTCLACGSSKRFSSGANRQLRREKRTTEKANICTKDYQ